MRIVRCFLQVMYYTHSHLLFALAHMCKSRYLYSFAYSNSHMGQNCPKQTCKTSLHQRYNQDQKFFRYKAPLRYQRHLY